MAATLYRDNWEQYAAICEAEIERRRAEQENAERTIRSWHKAALAMCDFAIGGDCKGVEDLYFDTAMSLPYYGADPDPLPCQHKLTANEQNATGGKNEI